MSKHLSGAVSRLKGTEAKKSWIVQSSIAQVYFIAWGKQGLFSIAMNSFPPPPLPPSLVVKLSLAAVKKKKDYSPLKA